MDGLLLDTEDIYTDVTNTLLRRHGRPPLPWSIKAQLQGRPGPEASRIFHAWAQLPIPQDEYMAEQSKLQHELFPNAKPLPGVVELLETLKTRTGGAVRLALATSSHSGNYGLKTARWSELFDVFPAECRVLGDDPRLGKGRGKPAPDIYLLALEMVNARLRREGVREEELIRPEECLVFEDSVPGVEAGRRAGMQVVWCPHPGLREEYQGREEEVLAGMTGEHKEADDQGARLAQANEMLVQKETGEKRRDGKPGQVGDGWGVYLETLENFPYERFGIKIA
ncbi:Haloacid dehalogenase-like hydrolase [Macrophomina phaseolina MS6]|uniref:Haloacid dehalogenase-like hydrolase n=2 Tax=Macrophomina phaseolina TaxID=35725 RepID=K2S3I3_MACPH|nr:Haloacid dehalogenase-like hydrolase [Macrophomina phaseolina MS6]